MQFNFYEEYTQYNTIELLKIILQPGDYQPAAIDAAKQILAERNISETDIEIANIHVANVSNKPQNRQQKIDMYKNKATDILEPLVKPSKEVEPAKWLNVLLLIISLVYAFAFYTTFKEIIHFIGCNYCHFTFVQAAEWVSLAYMPVNLYLLFKRKRWGWILLYANNMFILVTQIGEIHLLLKYQSITSANMLSFFLPIALRIAFALFLWKDNIAGLFNVSALTKKATTVIMAAAAVFFILMMNIFY